jgi:single stranded DNA-binding protein
LLWKQKPSLLVPQKNGAEKGDIFMSYLNSITIVGFVGADPEQRQARNNGSKFTVLSVATQRSWKNAEDEWVSKVEWHRVAIFRPRLAEAVLANIKKGAHVLVEGTLVSSIYEQPNGKSKKSKASKISRGRFAPMSCASSIAASRNPMLRFSPHPRFGLAPFPAAEEGSGLRVSEHRPDGLAVNPARRLRRRAAASSASLSGISWRMRNRFLLPSSRAAAVEPFGM